MMKGSMQACVRKLHANGAIADKSPVLGGDVRFGKLPQPVFGGAWWRGGENAALLHAACGRRGQRELYCERSQDVVTCQEQECSRQGIAELDRVQLALDWELLHIRMSNAPDQ